MAIDGFTTAKKIASRLNKQFNRKHFDPAIVGEWCAQVEVEYVRDTDMMWEFRAVPLTVGNDKMVLLPCNVYKIIELYNEDKEFLSFNRSGNFLTEIRNRQDENSEVEIGDTIYISYKGIPVDQKTGEVIIPSGHQPMCETYCKLRMFEEDVGYGQFSGDMWGLWDRKFSGQLQAVRSSYRGITKEKLNQFQIVMGNMLPKIGRMTIETEQFD